MQQPRISTIMRKATNKEIVQLLEPHTVLADGDFCSPKLIVLFQNGNIFRKKQNDDRCRLYKRNIGAPWSRMTDRITSGSMLMEEVAQFCAQKNFFSTQNHSLSRNKIYNYFKYIQIYRIWVTSSDSLKISFKRTPIL